MLMVTIIWMSILDYLTGPINGLLKELGGTSAMIGFLNTQNVIASLAWINTWRHAGYNPISRGERTKCSARFELV